MSLSFVPTPSQRSVIGLRDGAYLVLAPPGSGKTEVLTQRVVALLRENARESFRILALTFTRKAADTMRARLWEQVRDRWHRVTVTTFHAFCLDVLRHHGQHIGLDPEPIVYDSTDDLLDTLALGLKTEAYELPRADNENLLKSLLADISRFKRTLKSPERIPRDSVRDGIPLGVAYAAYERTLRQRGALDFDDLLQLTYRVFIEQPRVARHYRRLYRYIVVDEAQDTSAAQYALLRALCGDEHRNVMLVADPDQFIYRFAGASDRYLKAFIEDFRAKETRLTESFRCAEAIARAASALIARNHDRPDERAAVRPATRARGSVTAAAYEDEEAEAEGVLRSVQQWLRSGLDPAWLGPDEEVTLAAEDVCVLGRARHHLDAVLDRLASEGIQVAFRSGPSLLFESPLFRFVHRALRVLNSENDVVAREALLAEVPAIAGDEGEILRSQPLAPFFAALARVAPGLVADAATLFARANGSTTDPLPLGRLLEQLRALSQMTQPGTADLGDDERGVVESDARALWQRWTALRGRSQAEPSLGALLADLSLAGRTALDEPGVRVLTVHAAKGLEFKAVVLVGMNEGSFPDFRALKTEAGLKDERRNAYVAVTRSSRRLHLTRPKLRGMPWGAAKPQQPSRFVSEMGLTFEETPAPPRRKGRVG